MTKATLKIIADTMRDLGIPYGLLEFNQKPIVYPYFVGEYIETASMTEDGMTDTSFTLTGYSRTTLEDLEDYKDKIAEAFDQVSGKTSIAENGNGVAIWYENAQMIPTWDEELKKMQINLHVKEWKVN